MRIIERLLEKLLEKVRKQKAKPEEKQAKLSTTEIEFLPAALEVMEMPPSPIGRGIIWVLIVSFVIAFVWALVGEVEEVAIATGKVVPSGYTKVIQAEDKGVVKAVHVKEGSKVKAGDVLVELDTTITAADLNNLQKEKTHLSLEINRLMAELKGTVFSPPEELCQDQEDVQYQKMLYETRKAEHQTKIAMTVQMVEQAKAALHIAGSTKEKISQQLEIAADKEEKMKTLLEENAVSDFSYQDYKEKKIVLQQEFYIQQTEIGKANAALLQNTENLHNIMKEREKEIMTQLVEDRKQLKSIEEELKKAQEKNRLCTIKAPIDGTVQQMVLHTIGGVVTPAQELMMIVPEGTKMEIEAWVDNQDIGFVQEGQKAEIKIATFNFQKFGTLDAKVSEISTDAIEDKEKGLIYRALCNTTQDYVMIDGKKVHLMPGMSVTAEIKTRKKRIIEFFLDPFLKYKSEGLRER